MSTSSELPVEEQRLIRQAQDASEPEELRRKAGRTLVYDFGWGWAKIDNLRTVSPTSFDDPEKKHGGIHWQVEGRKKPIRNELKENGHE